MRILVTYVVALLVRQIFMWKTPVRTERVHYIGVLERQDTEIIQPNKQRRLFKLYRTV